MKWITRTHGCTALSLGISLLCVLSSTGDAVAQPLPTVKAGMIETLDMSIQTKSHAWFWDEMHLYRRDVVSGTTEEIFDPSGAPIPNIRGMLNSPDNSTQSKTRVWIWNDVSVFEARIGFPTTTEEILSPIGLSIANVRGIVGNPDASSIGQPVGQSVWIWNHAGVFLHQVGITGTTQILFGGAPISNIRGMVPTDPPGNSGHGFVWMWSDAGGVFRHAVATTPIRVDSITLPFGAGPMTGVRGMLFSPDSSTAPATTRVWIWNGTDVYLHKENTTTTDKITAPSPPSGASIGDVRGMIWTVDSNMTGAKHSVWMWNSAGVFRHKFNTANPPGTETEEITDPFGGSITGVRGIIHGRDEFISGQSAPWIWNPLAVYKHDPNTTSTVEITDSNGNSISNVRGIVSTFDNQRPKRTSKWIWSASGVFLFDSLALTNSTIEIKNPTGGGPIFGVRGIVGTVDSGNVTRSAVWMWNGAGVFRHVFDPVNPPGANTEPILNPLGSPITNTWAIISSFDGRPNGNGSSVWIRSDVSVFNRDFFTPTTIEILSPSGGRIPTAPFNQPFAAVAVVRNSENPGGGGGEGAGIDESTVPFSVDMVGDVDNAARASTSSPMQTGLTTVIAGSGIQIVRDAGSLMRNDHAAILATTLVPTGACCDIGGGCVVATRSDCGGIGGSHQGNGTTCTPNPCTPPPGACPADFEWGFVTSGGPSSRENHAMAYDPVRRRVVLFGGNNISGGLQDTWEWDGIWALGSTTGPDARLRHGMATDPVGGVVMFGGQRITGVDLSDTWNWDGTTWTAGPAGVPGARSGLAMAFDPANSRAVLMGGSMGSVFNDTWLWDGSAWALLGGGSPGFRVGHAMAHDTARRRTVLSGGFPFTNDTWELAGNNWMQVSTAGPGTRRDHAMAYDASRGVTVLFGGQDLGGVRLDDTWEWDGTAWKQIATTGPRPTAREGSAMGYHAARRQILLVGGTTATGFNSETWVYPALSQSRAFNVLGASGGTGWSWCINQLSGPGFSVCDLNVPGVLPGPSGNAAALADRFVETINSSGCSGVRAVANGSVFTVTIGGSQGFSFCVGPFGQQPNCCFPPASSCSFNPDMEEVVLTGNDCNRTGIDDAIDIANGASMDLNADGVPDECGCPVATTPEPDRFAGATGALLPSENNRYLSFSAGDPGRMQAIRVRFGGDPMNLSLPAPYDVPEAMGGWLGREFWVQQPQTLGTNPGSTIGAPLAPGESFINVAALGSTAFFTDWTQVADSSGSSVIHVYDVGVVPSVKGGASADYDVQVIDRDCGQMREADFSLPLPLTNCVWGDITGPFFNGRPTECDGVIDTRDIVTEIDAFSGKAAGPPKQKADLLRNGLNPGVVDGVIDFVGEVTRVVDAATGAGYPPSFFAPPP